MPISAIQRPVTSAAAAEQALFAETLACDDEFPLALRAAANAHEWADSARRAEIMLRAIAALEDSRSDDAEGQNIESPLTRLESKVDMTLGLLSLLVTQQYAIPPSCKVHWSRHGLRLSQPSAIEVGSRAILSVYLFAALPMPVDLPLEVIYCEADETAFRLWLKIPSHLPALQAAIERELFRRHRRAIAERRSAS